MKDKEKRITINREAGAMVDLLNNEIEELQKAKAIEEMEDIISGSWNTRSAAKNLSNAGYRKLPEDSVVLSREEFKNYCNLSVENEVLKEEKEQFENDVCNYEMNLQHLTGELEQVRKETAEKLLNDFKLWAREYQYKDTVVDENGERPMTNNEKLNYLYTYLCDKYKVEIKE